MFTGIIQTTGSISAIEPRGGDSRFVFNTGKMDLSDLTIGDSVAVNGACLTIIEKENNSFTADLSKETLELTTFSGLVIDSRINLEKAMLLSDRINGHMVSGHVDGIGKVINKSDDARSVRYTIEIPSALSRYVSKKGSVTVDGVSLTINAVDGNTFNVNIIPHTLSETIFSEYKADTRVNIEVDLIARYLDQLITKE
jgi:riboflavin synthase